MRRYRVVYRATEPYFKYSVERKLTWWPFWVEVGYANSLENAKCRISEKIAVNNDSRHGTVLYEHSEHDAVIAKLRNGHE